MTLILTNAAQMVLSIGFLAFALFCLLCLIPGGPGHIPMRRLLECHRRGLRAYRGAFAAYRTRHVHEWFIERTRDADKCENSVKEYR
jgi:hypothetical protein